jgi:LPS sulfotransferase NodH
MRVWGTGLHRFPRTRRGRSALPSVRIKKTMTRPPHRGSPIRTYLICTNPRSGSWLLSEALASTSLAGNPREWFSSDEEQLHRAEWHMANPADPACENYLDYVRAKSTTANGICGIKLHYYQFAELTRKLSAVEGLQGLPTAELMSAAFPNIKYLWLRRRDKQRQAISYQLACCTDQWWVIDGVKSNRRADIVDEPDFDPHAIACLEQILVENDLKWQSYFRSNNIAPLVLDYEDLVADYRGTVVRVLDWLGIPNAAAADVTPPRLKQQSNARNEEWLARYATFKTAGGHAVPSAQAEIVSPLFERSQKPHDAMPAAWKQWIARNRLRKTPDEAIIEVLTRNGYSRELATAEVGRAASDPFLLAAAEEQQHLNKTVALLNIMQRLADLDSKAKVIEKRSNLSHDEFRDRYYAANRPVIITHLMGCWRAMTAWTPDYLKSTVGDQMVEIMSGREDDPRYELNPQKHRTMLRFADFIDMVYSGNVTNDYYMVANNTFFQRPGVQPLMQDIAIFPEFLDPTAAGRQCFLWFGPAGTVTPLHHDPCNILISQVIGRKRYRLIPTAQWQYVYNSVGVFSDVDCENPDLSRHPQFRDATIIDFVLEPGEVLFMPVGWWHHVRALDVSMSVSFTNFVFPNLFSWAC